MTMKIKYRISDGEVLAWGSMEDIQPGSGEAVEEVSSDESLTGKIRVSRGVYRDKSKEEKDLEPSVVNKKRLEELKLKPKLTADELTEVLRIHNLI